MQPQTYTHFNIIIIFTEKKIALFFSVTSELDRDTAALESLSTATAKVLVQPTVQRDTEPNKKNSNLLIKTLFEFQMTHTYEIFDIPKHYHVQRRSVVAAIRAVFLCRAVVPASTTVTTIALQPL